MVAAVQLANVVVIAARDLFRAREFAQTISIIGLSVGITKKSDQAACILPGSLMILDCPPERAHALYICRHLRSQRSCEPLILIAPGCESRRRAAFLEAGANAVLGEPFCPRELLATIFSLLRHRADLWGVTHRSTADGSTVSETMASIRAGLWCHPDLDLTETERRLLKRVGLSSEAVSTGDLIEAVYSTAKLGLYSSALRVHIHRLRRKLAEIGWTVRGLHGFGYRLDRLPRDARTNAIIGESSAKGAPAKAGEVPGRARRNS